MAFNNATTVTLSFEEEKPIAALDLSALIFDLNRLYVLALRLPDESYGSVRQFRNYGRNSYRLSKDLRLDVARIRFESPGLIEFATALTEGVSAIWIMVQVIEKLSLWSLNKQKLQLEVQKLQIEAGKSPRLFRRERIEPLLYHSEVTSVAKALQANPLKPSDIKISPGS